MGSWASRLEERYKDSLLDGRLADIKQAKKTRDIETSLKIAATRDRLCWIAGYYGFMGLMSLARHASLHRRGIPMHWDNFFLPLNVAVICMPPFLFTYQLDLALSPTIVLGMPIGGKANRLAEEAARIRAGAQHRWFDQWWLPDVDDSTLSIHRPVCLPPILEASYQRERARSAKATAARGLPEEPDWAYFQNCQDKLIE
eukprot:TRINITY_DN11886_c0_g1_i2.p1 TRINITY_DN11886_c0_g1~~TRINITY_DN11886_c0_g1_i2.p1  ORF type:complete len:216 (+),score=31.89 TRINITY_DN11886_c0_g1_i2:49-648(+)